MRMRMGYAETSGVTGGEGLDTAGWGKLGGWLFPALQCVPYSVFSTASKFWLKDEWEVNI